MTASQSLAARWAQDLQVARAELADCRRKRLTMSAEFWQRTVCRLYLNLRRTRSWA